MHSSGSMTRKLGPSWKQSTGQTSTQSMYLHLMQLSVTTNVMTYPSPALLNLRLFCQTISSFRSTFQLGEMMALAPGAAVRVVLPQRKLAARKCQFRPRNLGLIVQADLQALRPGREFRLQQFSPEHHMHLI